MSTTAVREKPILFSGPMVRAILEGRKTQTRRIIKLNHAGRVKKVGSSLNWHLGDPEVVKACPYPVGTRLWVKETWQQVYHAGGGHWSCVTKPRQDSKAKLVYLADVPDGHHPPRWRSSIHMFRWASRIDLEVTGVKVERVQDITPEDVNAEGASAAWVMHKREGDDVFSSLWDTVNGKGSWASNPWVWAYTFKRVTP